MGIERHSQFIVWRVLAACALLLPGFAPAAEGGWDPTTSGPFLTGTADTEPPGSFFFEAYAFDFFQPDPGIHTVYVPLRLDVGVLDGLDCNALVPYQANAYYGSDGAWHRGGGVGDAQLWCKAELRKASGPWPTFSVEAALTLPSGNYGELNPSLYDADQNGLGTLDGTVTLLARKRFRPFEAYAQVSYTISGQARVPPGYNAGNGAVLPQGGLLTPGDVLGYAAAFEHVISDRWNAGWLVEVYGGASWGHGLLYGRTPLPGWSYLWAAPEVEINLPRSVAWGAGVMLPLYQTNYLRTITPMLTATYSYYGPEGHR